MLLDEIDFHAGSFAPAFSGRKVYPVYRLQLKRGVREFVPWNWCARQNGGDDNGQQESEGASGCACVFVVLGGGN
jgi:hypothetical protein